IRVNREQLDVLVHAFIHRAIEFGERRQVSADLVLLIRRLLQEAFGHDETDVLAGEQDLREAILHTTKAVGDMLEAAAVEDRFLNAGDKPEAEVLCDLADLSQERKVKNQIVILAGSQVFEKLVDYQQDAVVGMDLGERRHHLFEGGLVIDDLVGWREGIADAVLVEEYLKLLRDDVPQGHLAR